MKRRLMNLTGAGTLVLSLWLAGSVAADLMPPPTPPRDPGGGTPTSPAIQLAEQGRLEAGEQGGSSGATGGSAGAAGAASGQVVPEGVADPADSLPGELSIPVLAPPVHPAAPSELSVQNPPNSDGLKLLLSWKPSISDTGEAADNPVRGYAVFRSESLGGPYVPVGSVLPAGTSSTLDRLGDGEGVALRDSYYYVVAAVRSDADVAGVLATPSASAPVAGSPEGALFNFSNSNVLLVILLFGGLVFYYTREMRRGKKYFIRRIPGIDAIEEAIGRSTEMGKPILYVPGIDELQDIQTIASMLILGRVAEIVANYESEIIVPCTYPMVREVADEVVRAGYYLAGRPDAYDARSVRFISSEQFAFCAGTNGIILRQKPAANLYLGRFFAESLLFAETGFVNRSIQIAGTAEPTQLPFFVVSCDYTIIGEELFAVSAYLSHDPRLVSSLRASDVIKAIVVLSILLGTLLSTLGIGSFALWWTPGGN